MKRLKREQGSAVIKAFPKASQTERGEVYLNGSPMKYLGRGKNALPLGALSWCHHTGQGHCSASTPCLAVWTTSIFFFFSKNEVPLCLKAQVQELSFKETIIQGKKK